MPFNADFDGDQMAVHVPLSNASIGGPIIDACFPQHAQSARWSPITLPSQDMVLGLYYLQKERAV